MGHYANKSPRKSKQKSKKGEDSDHDGGSLALYVAASPRNIVSNNIYIDGGCNYHAFKDKEYFVRNL